MKVKFSEVSVGAKFTYAGKEYYKIEPIKISCCKTVNAKAVDSEKVKISVTAVTEVEIK